MGTRIASTNSGFDERIFATLDRVIEKAGGEYSVHGEVRSPLDHFLSLTGMENGLIALLDSPEKVHEILDVTPRQRKRMGVEPTRRTGLAFRL